MEHAFWLPQNVTKVQEVSSSSVHDMLAHGFSQVSLFFSQAHESTLCLGREMSFCSAGETHYLGTVPRWQMLLSVAGIAAGFMSNSWLPFLSHTEADAFLLLQVFTCSVCQEVFKRRMELRLHVVSHTGEMPYKVSSAHSSTAWCWGEQGRRAFLFWGAWPCLAGAVPGAVSPPGACSASCLTASTAFLPGACLSPCP